MRVLINAASANMGGAVTYVKNVVRWLPETAPQDAFLIILPAHTLAQLDPLTGPNVELRGYPHAHTGGAARLLFDQVSVPRIAKAWGADVLFSSTGFGTFAGAVPEVLLVRNPVYFNEAFQAKYRELGRSLLRTKVRRLHSIASIRRADVVLFPTRAMRDMVAPYVDLSKISTAALHYGFDHAAFAARGGGRAPRLSEICAWKSEGYRILLSVSTFAVHKNFEVLAEALAHLRGQRVKLVTTTSRERTSDKAEYDALQRQIEALGVRDDFVEIGYVPYNQLGSLYEVADAYVFPSFTESFGHSMVEAMAAGLPMVVADEPVNREVCGAAAVCFDTFDGASCAAAIAGVLTDPARLEALRVASLERAQAFSWEHYTRQLVEVLRKATRA